jgi:hypothetical protein
LFASQIDILTLRQIIFSNNWNCKMKGNVSFVVFHLLPKKRLYIYWAFNPHLKILGLALSLEIQHS